MACEMAFLPPRLEQLDHIEGLLARGVDVVADWVWWQTPLFARLTLPDDEFDVYSTLVSRLERGLPVPDAVVCLTANPDKLVGRVTRRGRESEKTMSVDYLSQVREAYLGWRTSAPGNTRWLHMDTTNMDFEQDAGARASAVAQICSLMGEQA
jgi:deoxyadenosine/deoxycytidine kinase